MSVEYRVYHIFIVDAEISNESVLPIYRFTGQIYVMAPLGSFMDKVYSLMCIKSSIIMNFLINQVNN